MAPPSGWHAPHLFPMLESGKTQERESKGKPLYFPCSFSYTFTAVWGFSKLHMCRRTLAGGREFWLPLPEDWKEKDTQWASGYACVQIRWLHHSGGAWACGRAWPGSSASLHVVSTSTSCSFLTGCFSWPGPLLKATSVECILSFTLWDYDFPSGSHYSAVFVSAQVSSSPPL